MDIRVNLEKFKDQWEQLECYQVVLWASILTIIIFFLWAGLTHINQQVRGIGKVIPSGKVRTIQHLEGGIVREILVKEGQKVNAGDVLFHLTNKKAESDMKEINVALRALFIKAVRLQAEAEGKEEPVFPDNLESNDQKLMEDERALFLSRKAEITEKLNGLQKRMKQKVLRLDDLNINISNLKRERDVAQEKLKIRKKLRSSGAISESLYLDAESNVKSFDTRISKLETEIPITKSELSEIVNLLEETKQGWVSDVNQELNNVNLDIQKLKQRNATFTDTVNRTAIESPVNGIVNKININTIGGVIQAGQVLADIIPLEESLIVEGRIATSDRGKVWIGLPVVAKITAYDYSTYGGIEGKLTYISADSFVDSQDRQYYQVRVELSRTKLSDSAIIYPGMVVDMNILSSKISVLGALLRPLTNINQNALREL